MMIRYFCESNPALISSTENLSILIACMIATK
jgi:hypothetical protein